MPSTRDRRRPAVRWKIEDDRRGPWRPPLRRSAPARWRDKRLAQRGRVGGADTASMSRSTPRAIATAATRSPRDGEDAEQAARFGFPAVDQPHRRRAQPANGNEGQQHARRRRARARSRSGSTPRATRAAPASSQMHPHRAPCVRARRHGVARQATTSRVRYTRREPNPPCQGARAPRECEEGLSEGCGRSGPWSMVMRRQHGCPRWRRRARLAR